jgi:hypothetical protein
MGVRSCPCRKDVQPDTFLEYCASLTASSPFILDTHTLCNHRLLLRTQAQAPPAKPLCGNCEEVFVFTPTN